MNNRPIGSFIATVAALFGPPAIALIGSRLASDPHPVIAQILSVAASPLLVVAVYAHALLADRIRRRDLGFARVWRWSGQI